MRIVTISLPAALQEGKPRRVRDVATTLRHRGGASGQNRCLTTNVLIVIFALNLTTLVVSIFLIWLDIRLFGACLYLVLVTIVTLVIVLAFCVVGTDEQSEPTVAKDLLSKSRQTLRRYATVRRSSSVTHAAAAVNIERALPASGHADANVEAAAARATSSRSSDCVDGQLYEHTADEEEDESSESPRTTASPLPEHRTRMQLHTCADVDVTTLSGEHTVIYL